MAIFDKLFLNIGAMKAGTSWLFENLKDHEDISVVPIKEIHYFWDKHGDFRLLSDDHRIATAKYHINRLLPSLDPKTARPLLEWFLLYLGNPIDDAWFANLFPNRAETVCCADFSNMYALLSAGGWRHVTSTANEVRISYGLRAPMTRMWSHARFHASIIGKKDELMNWDRAQFEEFLQATGCVRHGAYSETITNLDNIFGRKNILIWVYEDIRDHPGTVLSNFEKFLGISHHTYRADLLAMKHNVTPWFKPPDSFLEAAKSFVAAELENLERINFSIPASWASD